MVKILTVLVSTISNSQVFLLKNIFSAKKSRVFAIFNDQSFNDMLTNNIVSFEHWVLIVKYIINCIGIIIKNFSLYESFASIIWPQQL